MTPTGSEHAPFRVQNPRRFARSGFPSDVGQSSRCRTSLSTTQIKILRPAETGSLGPTMDFSSLRDGRTRERPPAQTFSGFCRALQCRGLTSIPAPFALPRDEYGVVARDGIEPPTPALRPSMKGPPPWPGAAVCLFAADAEPVNRIKCSVIKYLMQFQPVRDTITKPERVSRVTGALKSKLPRGKPRPDEIEEELAPLVLPYRHLKLVPDRYQKRQRGHQREVQHFHFCS